MRQIPFAEFKDKASQIISAVEAGEEIVITRHGKPSVRMLPATEALEERRERARAALEEMAKHRERMRAEGRTVSSEEWIAWKNEGRH